MTMFRLAIGALAALLAAASAAAQDALGDGRALDANPQVGSQGRNTRVFGPDFSARNALITGNVVAGRGFRDTVGYTAATDFRDELGSDDLFSFRAESALTNPILFSAGRTLERLRFGQHLGIIEYQRTGRGATPADLDYDAVSPGDYDRDRLMLDQLALQAADDLIYRGAIQPEIIGAYTDEEGNALVASASSLRGLVIGPMAGQPQMLGLTPYDAARVREDSAKGAAPGVVGEAFTADFKDLLAPDRLTDVAESAQIEPGRQSDRIDPAYRDVMSTIAERYAAAQQDATGDQARLTERLDDMLLRIREELAATAPDEATSEEGFDVQDAAAILRHGEVIEGLAAPDDPQRFEELMLQAAQMIKRGEYFWAERRFARALRFSPGHPLATAGIANAQIGAGLHVPAGLSLRKLFIEHPEMIDTRFGPDLLPNSVRLDIAVRRIERDLDRSRKDRALYGLVLAYLGHQTDDAALIRRGLDVMQEHAPGDGLLPLLRAVWTEGGDAPERER